MSDPPAAADPPDADDPGDPAASTVTPPPPAGDADDDLDLADDLDLGDDEEDVVVGELVASAPGGVEGAPATAGWRQRLTADEITRTVIDAVHTAAESRWEPAQQRAAELFGVTHEQKLIALRKSFQRELVGLGTATGAVGALPGAGTATAITVGLADIGWVTARNADIVLTVAALHGHTQAEVEERTAWILAVLVFGGAAAASFQQLERELSKKAASAVTSATFKKLNKTLAKKVFKSYGTKKGILALGKALPFGVGAAFGGASSYTSLKALIKDSDAFFGEIPRTVRPITMQLAPTSQIPDEPPTEPAT